MKFDNVIMMFGDLSRSLEGFIRILSLSYFLYSGTQCQSLLRKQLENSLGFRAESKN